MTIDRRAIVGLSASAALVVGLLVSEGYTDKAIIPVKGDVPTYGFGMTYRADGSPVQMGDKTNPIEAVQRSLSHIQKDELGIKRCVTAPLSQNEYDLMVGFAYQYGVPTLCKSSMVKRANRGDYIGSCMAYLEYKKVDGYDCSTPGNKRCYGVWLRSKERYEKCLGG